jgi:hypothetical protein
VRLGPDVPDDPGGSDWGNLRVEELSEEVFDTLLSYLLYPFLRWEAKPLCGLDQTFHMILEGMVRGRG